MIEAVLKNLTDPEWWADQILSYALFSLIAGLIAGWFANALRRRAERMEREPYEGWTLVTCGFGDRPQAIYWEDMKRFLTSDVELWRWIKSVCSTTCYLTSRTAETAKQHGWLVIDRAARKVIIDYRSMPAEDVRWSIDPPWVKGGGSGSPAAEDTARAPL
ncbi:MAG: hypothetical protein P9C36_06645 [Defluviicoccus sp.]|nr:hypothetical protein [Defluviicoccus sp.]MDG4592287.1 hypothetical protein [Defluviicoccus sp.]